MHFVDRRALSGPKPATRTGENNQLFLFIGQLLTNSQAAQRNLTPIVFCNFMCLGRCASRYTGSSPRTAGPRRGALASGGSRRDSCTSTARPARPTPASGSGAPISMALRRLSFSYILIVFKMPQLSPTLDSALLACGVRIVLVMTNRLVCLRGVLEQLPG